LAIDNDTVRLLSVSSEITSRVRLSKNCSAFHRRRVNCDIDRGTQYSHLSLVARVRLVGRREDSNMPQDAHWKVMYQAAMLELNPARLQASIDIAHSAMQRRIEELKAAGTQHSGNCAEMQEIMDAQNSLRTLERWNAQSLTPATTRTATRFGIERHESHVPRSFNALCTATTAELARSISSRLDHY